jgi:hypothetical protein
LLAHAPGDVPFRCTRQHGSGGFDIRTRVERLLQSCAEVGEAALEEGRDRVPESVTFQTVAGGFAQIRSIGQAAGCTEAHLDVAPVNVKRRRIQLEQSWLRFLGQISRRDK